MTNRLNKHGFAYSNDPVRISAVGAAIIADLNNYIDTDNFDSAFHKAIQSCDEYNQGLTNGEYQLALAAAFSELQRQAFERFTKLIREVHDEDDDDLPEDFINDDTECSTRVAA